MLVTNIAFFVLLSFKCQNQIYYSQRYTKFCCQILDLIDKANSKYCSDVLPDITADRWLQVIFKPEPQAVSTNCPNLTIFNNQKMGEVKLAAFAYFRGDFAGHAYFRISYLYQLDPNKARVNFSEIFIWLWSFCSNIYTHSSCHWQVVSFYYSVRPSYD